MTFDKTAQPPEYHEFFKRKKLKARIRGHLMERYDGVFLAAPAIFKSPVADLDLLAFASEHFAPPVYIGISETLNDRLETHANELTKLIYTGPPPPSATFTSAEISEGLTKLYREPSFAERAGTAIQTIPNLGVNSFIVKVVEMPAGYSKQHLESVEYFLNRTFIPMYGWR